MAVDRAPNQTQRRLLFGVNVILQIVLAVALAVGVVWMAGRVDARADLTRTGINSLSPATEQLLDTLEQPLRVTCLFAKPNEERDPLGLKRWREMEDLLRLYDGVGGAQVTAYMLDPSLQQRETDELLQRLTRLPAYAEEAQPHREVLEQFPQLNEQITTLATSEFEQTEQLAQQSPQLGQNRNFAIVRNNLQLVARDAGEIVEDIEQLKQGEIPRYGQAVREVTDYLTNTRLRLEDAQQWMAGEAQTLPGMTPEILPFFQESGQRYQPVLDAIADMITKAQELEDVQLEQVHTDLARWRTNPVVLVESPREARVIPFFELWLPPEPGAPLGPEGESRQFAGEAAISSAILALTQEEKTAVVFTYYGGQSPIKPDFSQLQRNPMMMNQMPRAPYQALAEELEKANFITEDWNVQENRTVPEIEDAARTVYVVFPPEQPQRPNPLQPAPEGSMTPDERKIVTDAIEASGMGIFLTGWAAPASPVPGATGSYPYTGYLQRQWGVDVQFDHLTLRFMPNPQRPGWWVPSRDPLSVATPNSLRLTEHPISEPLRNDSAAFRFTAPVRPADGEDMPADVVVEPIATIPETEDVWAVGDPASIDERLRRDQGIQPSDQALRAPFPVAVTATKADGAKKIVVFGSEQFAADALTQATGLQQIGNALVLGQLYPANLDLFKNALYWLTGDAERIAVGPRTGEMPRLSQLDDAWAERLPWLLVGVWPGLALLLGVGVWMVRRR